MALIDTHAHLNMTEFDKDREEVIKRANENGIKYSFDHIIMGYTSIIFKFKMD